MNDWCEFFIKFPTKPIRSYPIHENNSSETVIESFLDTKATVKTDQNEISPKSLLIILFFHNFYFLFCSSKQAKVKQ